MTSARFADVLYRLDKPEYFFRPMQLLRRLTHPRLPEAPMTTFRLPWGLDLKTPSRDFLGHSLWHLGVYDLMVSEAIWRLVDEGATVVDVGANHGYMTSLLARRAGKSGRVVCFEPHPEIFRRLRQNLACWVTAPGVAKVTAYPLALSDSRREATLYLPPDFEHNLGLATLEPPPSAIKETLTVSTSTLSDVFSSNEAISLIKVDAEGHEEAILRGGEHLLESGRIRDIIFEDHGEYPSPPMRLVEDAGYALFKLRKRFLGPKLVSPSQPNPRRRWEAVSYLATLDPARVKDRFRRQGWRLLELGSATSSP